MKQASGLKRGRPNGSETSVGRLGSWGLPDFAFLRAIAQGVREDDAWNRYLAFRGGSARRAGHAARLTRRLCADAEAKAHGEPDRAKTILSAVAALQEKPPPPASPPRTLEEWAAEEQIDVDFYSEAELIAMYEEATEPTAPVPMSALMLEPEAASGRLGALRALETLMARPPSPGDQLDAWLAPRLVTQLGGRTVGELSRSILHLGRRWAKGVQGVGVTQAGRLAEWLDLSFAPGHVAALQRPGRPGRPRAALPCPTLAALAARMGGQHPSLVDDALATERCLAEQGQVARQEVERFFLWLHCVEACPLADASDQTVHRYLAWARALAEDDTKWICRQPREQSDTRWRPFRKPLEERAAARAAVRLRTFLRKLKKRAKASAKCN